MDYDFSKTLASKIAKEFACKEKFSILDLGTGNGMFLQEMKKRFNNVDVKGVSAADYRSSLLGMGVKVPDEDYCVANLENLSKIPTLQGRKFHVIVSATTFLHLSDPLRTLSEAYEMLEPNGVLIVNTFSLNGISKSEYENLFKNHKIEIWYDPMFVDLFDSATIKIRKTIENMDLPVAYDLERCAPATANRNASIYYKLTS